MNLLLLAGSAEARALATRLAADARFAVTASLAGATRQPEALAVDTRIGGFGGAREQEKYIKDNGFDGVLDATHPFASAISWRTQGICARLGVPYLQLLRPGWIAGPGDDWRRVNGPEAVAGIIPTGATVFLATGRGSLDDFADLAVARQLIVRVVDTPGRAFPYPGGQWVVGRPPHRLGDEMRAFRALGVDWLVVKDAGGEAGRAKLMAARALTLPVVMIARPAQPPGETVADVAAALAWLERQL